MIQRLKIFYNEKVIPVLIEKMAYSNCHQIPKIEKIHINRSLGLAAQNNNI